MRTKQIIFAFILFFLMLQTSVKTFAAEKNTHCTDTEIVAFGCQLENSRKVVSVCTSKPFSRDEGYIQYRFGKIGKIELRYPSDLKSSQEQFTLTVTDFVGGWRSSLRFENSGIGYTIYDEAIKESPVSKDFERGIIVWKGNNKLASLSCKKGIQYLNTIASLDGDVPTEEIEY